MKNTITIKGIGFFVEPVSKDYAAHSEEVCAEIKRKLSHWSVIELSATQQIMRIMHENGSAISQSHIRGVRNVVRATELAYCKIHHTSIIIGYHHYVIWAE